MKLEIELTWVFVVLAIVVGADVETCTYDTDMCGWLDGTDPEARPEPTNETRFEIQTATICRFEADFCRWVAQQVTDVGSVSWQRHRGPSPGGDLTGPDVDNTFKNEDGYYLMADSTTSIPGSSAVLFSEDQYTSICIEFYYYLFGPHVGSLSLGIITHTGQSTLLWFVFGQQGDAWIKHTYNTTDVDFYNNPPYKVFIMYHFFGQYGVGAIDDCKIVQCIDVITASTTQSTAKTTSSGPRILQGACMANGTIVLDNPRPDEFTDAISYYSTTLCTTTFSSDIYRVTITGCDVGFLGEIIIIFQNQTIEDSLSNNVIVGGERPDVGAYKILCQFFDDMVMVSKVMQPVLTVDIHERTPVIVIQSNMRFETALGIITQTGVLGTSVVWGIDIPAVYNGVLERCRVLPGTSPVGPVSKSLINRGCSEDLDLVENFSADQFIIVNMEKVKRYYTTFYPFKFYDNDYITIVCSIRLCKADTDNCDFTCTNVRGKRDDSSADVMTTTSVVLKIVDPYLGFSSATTVYNSTGSDVAEF